MVWEVEVTDEFVSWWSTLTIEQQKAVTDRVDVLAERGQILVVRSSTGFIPRGIAR
jgi:hypothetical protein